MNLYKVLIALTKSIAKELERNNEDMTTNPQIPNGKFPGNRPETA